MNIDTIETWLTWAIGGLLFVSALLSLIRITLGPACWTASWPPTCWSPSWSAR